MGEGRSTTISRPTSSFLRLVSQLILLLLVLLSLLLFTRVAVLKFHHISPCSHESSICRRTPINVDVSADLVLTHIGGGVWIANPLGYARENSISSSTPMQTPIMQTWS